MGKCELTLVLLHLLITSPTDEDNPKMDGSALLLGVYSSSSKHLMGMGLVPCRDVPILGEQRLLDDTLPKRLRRDLSLVQVIPENWPADTHMTPRQASSIGTCGRSCTCPSSWPGTYTAVGPPTKLELYVSPQLDSCVFL